MKKITHPVIIDLNRLRDKEKAAFFPRFFKTGPGKYGFGDQFLGVTVPKQREIAKKYYSTITDTEIENLLDSEYHEVRLTSLIILVYWYQKRAKVESEKTKIVRLYQSKMNRINSWDLVDLSADKILGHYYFEKDHSYLHKLSLSNDLWKTRIAILSTFYFIRHLHFDDTIRMCKQLLTHKHDLIHKATGWMLREIGKRDLKPLKEFLKNHVNEMPRTMLRYAIEKLPESERKSWLKI